MTQACSKVLAHRRPLLALALVAALLAAAAVALSPARAATPGNTTWTVGLALRDADNDGVYQKGDTPRLLVTIRASIQPDADDQSNGGITEASVSGTSLTFDPSTRLNISGSQGIKFQTGTNTQVNVLTGAHLNAKAPQTTEFVCEAGADASSTGSSPAVAMCTIDTQIDVSIPVELATATYTISGKVQLAKDSGNNATDDVTATWVDDKGPATSGTGRVRNNTGSTDNLALGERTNSSASISFAIGVQPSITAVSLRPSNVCDAAGKVGAASLPAADRNKACKDRIPVSHETEYTLDILNAAGQGVVRGQIAAIVATLVRTGEGTGTATFSDCPGIGDTASPNDLLANNGRASCSPSTAAAPTGSPEDTVMAAYKTKGETFRIKAPSTPGAATLNIQVLAAAGGSFNAPPRNLVFVGPAKKITLSKPTSTVLNREADPSDANTTLADRSKGTDSITLTLSAEDARGNPASHPMQDYTYELTYKVTGPDGREMSRRLNDNTKITIGKGQKATSGSDANVESQGKVLIDVTAPATSPLTPGEYTVTVRRTAQGLRASETFLVVGPAASLDLEKGDVSAAIGSSVAISATVNDAAGKPVPHGTSVTFTASNADGSTNDLVILPGGSDNKTGVATTVGTTGKATLNGTVVGNGIVILIATTQGATGTVSDTDDLDTTSDAQSISATPTSCLSKTDVGDYATWTCEQTGNADAVFSVLRNRGADSLHLRSVGRWVPYATDAAGGPIPGSTNNFIIRQYDTLFIGG